jgi:hypothetical protein
MFALSRDRVIADLGLSTLLLTVMLPVWVPLFASW